MQLIATKGISLGNPPQTEAYPRSGEASPSVTVLDHNRSQISVKNVPYYRGERERAPQTSLLHYIFLCIARRAINHFLLLITSYVNSKTIHNTELHRANTLPVRWTMVTAQTETTRGPNHEQSNQALYLRACGDSKLDGDRWWTYLTNLHMSCSHMVC